MYLFSEDVVLSQSAPWGDVAHGTSWSYYFGFLNIVFRPVDEKLPNGRTGIIYFMSQPSDSVVHWLTIQPKFSNWGCRVWVFFRGGGGCGEGCVQSISNLAL